MNVQDPSADGAGSSGPAAGASPSEPPRLPGSPRLDYEFGKQWGWTRDTHLGLSLIDRPAAKSNAAGGLDRDFAGELRELARSYHQAFADLREWGVVGAIASTAAIVVLAPVEGVLAGVGAVAAAGAAVYSYTNIAVRLAGGGNALAGFNGLFSPVGLPVFVANTLGGAGDAVAIRRASEAHGAYSSANAFLGLGSGSAERVAQSLVKLGQNENYLKTLPAKYAWPDPVPQVRKPGGPVRVVLP